MYSRISIMRTLDFLKLLILRIKTKVVSLGFASIRFLPPSFGTSNFSNPIQFPYWGFKKSVSHCTWIMMLLIPVYFDIILHHLATFLHQNVKHATICWNWASTYTWPLIQMSNLGLCKDETATTGMVVTWQLVSQFYISCSTIVE